MKRIVLDVDKELHGKIKVKAAQANKSIRDILLDLIKTWLKRKT